MRDLRAVRCTNVLGKTKRAGKTGKKTGKIDRTFTSQLYHQQVKWRSLLYIHCSLTTLEFYISQQARNQVHYQTLPELNLARIQNFVSVNADKNQQFFEKHFLIFA
jgi:hypothetical protein